MPNLEHLGTWASGGVMNAVIESPRGSSVKLTYDSELGAFTVSRVLALGVTYPYDWGFIPSTRAPDGDPLDVMVVSEVSTYPGVVIGCRPIGVVRVSQKRSAGSGRERNDRIIAVSTHEPRLAHLVDTRSLAARQKEELEQFFATAVLFEGKGVRLLGWGGSSEACELIRGAAAAAARRAKRS